jgi:hypothetical protein
LLGIDYSTTKQRNPNTQNKFFIMQDMDYHFFNLKKGNLYPLPAALLPPDLTH